VGSGSELWLQRGQLRRLGATRPALRSTRRPTGILHLGCGSTEPGQASSLGAFQLRGDRHGMQERQLVLQRL